MNPSRRIFLKHVSAASAAGMAAPWRVRMLWGATPNEIVPEGDETLLRALALAAVDAARSAGASFADVRLSVSRAYRVECNWGKGWNSPPQMAVPSLHREAGYGVRAIVDGSWGFASGVELTADAIVLTARTAVEVARANRRRHARPLELAPMPAVPNGVYATPYEQDPFAVTIKEQGQAGLDAIAEAIKVPTAVYAGTRLSWRAPLTVFAATDGSVIVQRLLQGSPGAVVSAAVGPDLYSGADLYADRPIGGYGYEAAGIETLGTDMRRLADEATAKAKAARRPVPAEVGRYDIVFDVRAVAEMLVGTVADALNLERALGYLANEGGTSFAAPPEEMLGKYQLGAKSLTVRGDRSRLHGGATTGWDDEGVKPIEHTVVRDGVITDYHTNRETATEIGGWYRKRGEPVRSNGCARHTGPVRPLIRIPNLTLEPARSAVTMDDLIADTKHGFYVEAPAIGGSIDHQILNAQFATIHTGVRQISNGKLGGYVKDLAFQFITTEFWKGLDGLGGSGTAKSLTVETDGTARDDHRQASPVSTVHVVPARVRQVNVLNTGRTA